jgi:hypothetical protein
MFYDPHSGFGGAAVPLPSNVRKVAHELDGKILTLHDAIEKIKAVTTGKVKVEKDNWISFTITNGVVTHSWRLIRYRDPSTAA